MASRNPQGINRLSPAAIKYIAEPGSYAGGGGLHLEVGDGDGPDAGTALTYSLVRGSDQGRFHIDSTAGALSLDRSPPGTSFTIG